MLYDFLNDYRDFFKDDRKVIDSCKLGIGFYVLIKKDLSIEVLNVDGTDNVDINSELYTYFLERKYYSDYIDSNKAIDQSQRINGEKNLMAKKIFSTNPCALFFSSKSIEEFDIDKSKSVPMNTFLKGIDTYFDKLIEVKDGKNKESRELLSYMSGYSENISKYEYIYEKAREIFKSNFPEIIKTLKEKYNIKKECRINIFLEEDINTYSFTSSLYTCQNIFNKNNFNIKYEDSVYGQNGYNNSFSDGKVFLELKSTPFKVSSRISIDDIFVLRNMYIWLKNNINPNRLVKIPTNFDFKGDVKNENIIGSPIYLISIELDANKNHIISNFEFIPYYTEKIKEFTCTDCFNSKLKNIDFTISKRNELQEKVDEIWFSNRLVSTYSDPKRLADDKEIPLWKKRIIKNNKNKFIDFFYRLDERALNQDLDKIAFEICKNTLLDSFIKKENKNKDKKDSKAEKDNSEENKNKNLLNTYAALKCINLWIAFDSYFGGDFKMKKNNIYNEAKEIILNNGEISNDEEYYFFIGQVARYFINMSKAEKKTHMLINPLLNTKSREKVVNAISKMREKYSYDLNVDNRRFNNILKQIYTYESQTIENVLPKYILVGFLDDNLFYIKKEENREE